MIEIVVNTDVQPNIVKGLVDTALVLTVIVSLFTAWMAQGVEAVTLSELDAMPVMVVGTSELGWRTCFAVYPSEVVGVGPVLLDGRDMGLTALQFTSGAVMTVYGESATVARQLTSLVR